MRLATKPDDYSEFDLLAKVAYWAKRYESCLLEVTLLRNEVEDSKMVGVFSENHDQLLFQLEMAVDELTTTESIYREVARGM